MNYANAGGRVFATHYSYVWLTNTAENAVWTYEAPLSSVLALKAYLAFYPDKVEIQQLGLGEEPVEPHAVHP